MAGGAKGNKETAENVHRLRENKDTRDAEWLLYIDGLGLTVASMSETFPHKKKTR